MLFLQWKKEIARIVELLREIKKIIFIRDSDAEDPIYVKDSVFEYSNLYDRAFIQKIKRQLEIESERTDLEEAEWLVERGEYRTAVILALRYLEEKLAQRMDCFFA